MTCDARVSLGDDLLSACLKFLNESHYSCLTPSFTLISCALSLTFSPFICISLTFIPALTCSLNEEPLRPVRIAVAGVVATIAKVEVRPSTIY